MFVKIKNWSLLIVSYLLLTSFSARNSNRAAKVNYPTIDEIENILFYIERTVNTNTVVYELNTDKNGNINKEEPIKIYWINYENEQEIKDLTFIQNHYSYGIDWELIDEKDMTYRFNLEAYESRYFYLKRLDKDNKYHVFAYVNETYAEIEKLFVNIEGGTFWIPNVKYVKVDGKTIHSNKKVVEFIYP